MGSAPAIYPFLLALYPALFLWSKNAGVAFLPDVARSLVGLLLVTGALWIVLRALLRNTHAAALITSLVMMVLFLHEHVVYGLMDSGPARFERSAPLIAVAVEIALVAAVGFVVASRVKEGGRSKAILNLAALALVAFPVVEIARYAVDEGVRNRSRVGEEAPAPVALERPSGALPDIYFIVLDAYARADVLSEIYGYDNSEFIEFLRGRGFRFAEASRSNYSKTQLAIPSVLNLDYLDDLAERVGPRSRDLRPIRRAAQRNRVVASLAGLGYRFVQITTGYADSISSDADEIIGLTSPVERPNAFETVLLLKTPILDVVSGVAKLGFSSLPIADFHRRRLEYGLDALGRQARAAGPKFVYGHILSPHEPFVFGREGEPRSLALGVMGAELRSPVHARTVMSGYRDQVHHLNRMVRAAIERILEDSVHPPIIVIQGDHGPRYVRDCPVETFGILNAYLLPDANSESVEVYDEISPVNSFRLIFDRYFGSELGLLPDRSHAANPEGQYSFSDVTDRANTCPGKAAVPALPRAGARERVSKSD